jgi:lipopolysaccharide/colanic/teichoic acid biosynthesis glycosyltransferase
MLKRIYDVTFSFIGLVILSPLFLIIGILIKLADWGSVFYRGTRVGRNGKLFKMIKFRTMVVNADKIGGSSTADDDPRLLKVGKFLRKYKFDELPQLINVLIGEMSFVGPRPEVPFYVNMLTVEEKLVLSVKPGITDWASLWNSNEGAILAGSLDPEKTYLDKIRPEKIRLQLKYVKKHNFWIDLIIIYQTVLKIFKR